VHITTHDANIFSMILGGAPRMKILLRTIVFAVLATGLSGVALATGTQIWTGALTVSKIEAVGDSGGFVIFLTGFSDSNCSSNPTAIYVYPNALGVTPAGVNQMLALALTARATGGTVSVMYDDTGDVSAGLCFGRYLSS
jgi:hypothetical protein